MSNWNQTKEIEEKSKLFLNRIMGNERFIRFQKDGKIEFEVVNKLNEKITYELDKYGRVINKTKNQGYCIVADKSDYPIYDLIAIKYAYLIHGNEIAEKVANKTNYSNTTHSTHSTYLDYIDYLNRRGWTEEKVTINELCSLTHTESVRKNETCKFIYLRCPSGKKITLMGRQQVPMGADGNTAYKIKLNITDENGDQIPDFTKIRIVKERSSDFVIDLARMFYSDLKDGGHTFTHGVELNGDVFLEFYIVNPECNIPKENIKFEIEADIWRCDH